MTNLRLPEKPSNIKTIMTVVLLIVLLGGSAYQTEVTLLEFFQGFPEMGSLIWEMLPPDLAYLDKVWKPMLETVQMAVIGTTAGALVAIPIALLAARNVTKSPFLYLPARFILNLVRTIPDLLFAGIFVAVFGLGSFAGTLAISFFSFGLVAKLSYESIESIDPGPLEAMTSVGASKLQWIHFGVIPQVTAQFTAYLLYTFEVNVRAAAVLGLVGAGGIGLLLKGSLDLLRYDRASTIILMTLVIVIIIDYVSTKIREKLL
ncbi:phosphonate ABC transporter, permease protein PhnE [Paenibacillus sp. MBLB4367]|uniref:phosphonate ABC transporter, permease protein PhnE n=1 Tax=Paenibacillus sp. MBLB4367 TaxID=3384767 RepID=UPI0039082BD0